MADAAGLAGGILCPSCCANTDWLAAATTIAARSNTDFIGLIAFRLSRLLLSLVPGCLLLHVAAGTISRMAFLVVLMLHVA